MEPAAVLIIFIKPSEILFKMSNIRRQCVSSLLNLINIRAKFLPVELYAASPGGKHPKGIIAQARANLYFDVSRIPKTSKFPRLRLTNHDHVRCSFPTMAVSLLVHFRTYRIIKVIVDSFFVLMARKSEKAGSKLRHGVRPRFHGDSIFGSGFFPLAEFKNYQKPVKERV